MVLKTKVITTERNTSKAQNLYQEETYEQTGKRHEDALNAFTRTINSDKLKKISTTPMLGDFGVYIITTHITYLAPNN